MRKPSVIFLLALAGCATERASQTEPATAAPPARTAEVQAAPAKPATPEFVGAAAATGTVDAFKQRCATAIGAGQEQISGLKALPAPRDTGRALELFDEGIASLSDMAAQASTVANSHPDAAMRDAAEACEQQIEALYTDITLDRGVYDALVGVDLSAQDAATKFWIDDTLRAFRRSGVDKDEATRAQVKSLSEQLVKLGQQFQRNIVEDVRSISVAPKELEGLPQDWIRAHPAGPDGKVKVTTDYPDYNPFMAYAKSATAREALWRAFRMRGHPKNEAVLQQLLTLRHQLATLLGYANWAAYVMEDKMIKTEKNAAEFIDRIVKAAGPRAKKDFELLLARKKKDSPRASSVEPWDQAYLEDKVKAEQFAFNSQEVRPYFEYGRVKQGLFDITSKMFGVTYRKVNDAQVWSPEVEAYDVLDGEKLLGRFYLDMHPRSDKYKHAAQFTLVTGKAGVRLPEAVLMCNFPRTTADAPGLMLHSEVETFFHEFGHLIHHIFAGHQKWSGISGASMEWDFVEAPSQMLEEWVWNEEVLRGFARHVDTGEAIPAELVKKMKAADDFGRGLWVRQQMFYAATSLNLHNRDPKALDPVKLMKQLQEEITPFRYVPGTYFHLSFGHLNGYSAIYYTYMWSLVIAKDLFTRFESAGLMNPEPARLYREKVLGAGGSSEAAAMVREFLGRDYSFEAYERWLNQG